MPAWGVQMGLGWSQLPVDNSWQGRASHIHPMNVAHCWRRGVRMHPLWITPTARALQCSQQLQTGLLVGRSVHSQPSVLCLMAKSGSPTS